MKARVKNNIKKWGKWITSDVGLTVMLITAIFVFFPAAIWPLMIFAPIWPFVLLAIAAAYGMKIFDKWNNKNKGDFF